MRPLVLLCALWVCLPVRADDERPQAPPLTGIGSWFRVADDAPWRTDEGEVDLPALRGRVVVLKFWMSWCPGCQAVRPAFNRLQREHPDDLLVLGLTQLDARQDAAAVAAYAKTKAEFALGILVTNQILADYQVGKIPLAVVIDKRGRVAWRGNPALALPDFREAVRLALSEAAPETD